VEEPAPPDAVDLDLDEGPLERRVQAQIRHSGNARR
jgi:hypothetical protein